MAALDAIDATLVLIDEDWLYWLSAQGTNAAFWNDETFLLGTAENKYPTMKKKIAFSLECRRSLWSSSGQKNLF